MLSILRHPQIVTMFGYSRKDNDTCLITAYVEGGNLADAIADIHNVELGDLLILDICIAISKGMIFLHKKGIIHRDLKPENILIEDLQKAAVKVCDFGLSYTSGDNQQTIYGTPAYAAPELSTKGHTEKVDVYSFAITVWEMFVRKKAWAELNFTFAIAEKVGKGERPPLPKDCLLSNLIAKCWAQTPSDRPSFESIHSELETLKSTLVGPNSSLSGSRNNSTPSTPTTAGTNGGRLTMGTVYFNPRSNLEQEIVDEFKNGSLPWEKFVEVLVRVLEAKPFDVERLQYCITGGNKKVAVGKWINFTEWFTPLCKESEAQRADEKEGYAISEVADIVGHEWFFGSIGAEEVQRKLGLMNEDGGFLVRFSSSPGYYTVTAFKEKKVYHWRIGAEKKGFNRTEFDLEGHIFQSLVDAVEFFKTMGLTLPDGSIFKLQRNCAKQSQLYETGFSNFLNRYEK
eukprot:TRINITY_DN1369_c0_g2_i1.p1 TRINITY_DN1369_c0_g2~~TRINITY_DN1369_c0_g2_i1.p1  ORF type:complete len:457 (-),score=105.85 TRINITY_DN1369_c0_g2_i1:36-1406(-)